jgi:hypothetical protein
MELGLAMGGKKPWGSGCFFFNTQDFLLLLLLTH